LGSGYRIDRLVDLLGNVILKGEKPDAKGNLVVELWTLASLEHPDESISGVRRERKRN